MLNNFADLFLNKVLWIRPVRRDMSNYETDSFEAEVFPIFDHFLNFLKSFFKSSRSIAYNLIIVGNDSKLDVLGSLRNLNPQARVHQGLEDVPAVKISRAVDIHRLLIKAESKHRARGHRGKPVANLRRTEISSPSILTFEVINFKDSPAIFSSFLISIFLHDQRNSTDVIEHRAFTWACGSHDEIDKFKVKFGFLNCMSELLDSSWE